MPSSAPFKSDEDRKSQPIFDNRARASSSAEDGEESMRDERCGDGDDAVTRSSAAGRQRKLVAQK